MSFTKGKVVLAGQSATGKTSLLNKIMNNDITELTTTTTTAFMQKEFTFEDQNVSLNIWDTAGQERFRAVQTVYFRMTHIGLILFDFTDQRTFDDVSFWVSKFVDNSPRAILYLIGNKCDQPHNVSKQVATSFAEQNKMRFFKTSCVTGEGIQELLQDLGKVYVTCKEEIVQPKQVQVFVDKPEKNGCC